MATFVYIDETGPVGTSLKQQPLLTLVGVLVPEGQVMPLAERLRDLAFQHLGWLPADFEWHGQVLWNGSGVWTGKTPPELLAAFEDVIACLEELDLHVAHATIDKVQLHDRYGGSADANAYRLALQFLLEKLDLNTGGLKVIVADEAKEEQVYAQDMVTGMQQWSWGGEVPGHKLKSVIDSLHFVRSQANPGVQLADMTAFIVQKARRGAKHPDAQAALDRMRTLISDRTLTWRQVWPTS